MRKTAFEVEVINSRKNYVFKLDEGANRVYLYDTSRKSNGIGYKRELIGVFPSKGTHGGTFPWGCKTAAEYFNCLYKKSMIFSFENPVFIGWVDPETFEPLVEEEV
jgi:hypothetical protein